MLLIVKCQRSGGCGAMDLSLSQLAAASMILSSNQLPYHPIHVDLAFHGWVNLLKL